MPWPRSEGRHLSTYRGGRNAAPVFLPAVVSSFPPEIPSGKEHQIYSSNQEKRHIFRALCRPVLLTYAGKRGRTTLISGIGLVTLFALHFGPKGCD